MRDLLETYRRDGDLLALLKNVRNRHGGLSPALVDRLAAELALPVSELYGVITFYAFLAPTTVGRNTIRICRCLPCNMQTSDSLLSTIRNELGIGPGETTADGRFTLQVVNCIGACDVSPALLVNETRYGHLTPSRVAAILAAYS